MKYKNKEFVCLLDVGFETIRGKWKSIIICHLNEEPKRFLELQRITKGVSQKVLTENLKGLEEEGIIQKVVYTEIPPRVEYSLTNKGLELSNILRELEGWSKKYYEKSVDI